MVANRQWCRDPLREKYERNGKYGVEWSGAMLQIVGEWGGPAKPTCARKEQISKPVPTPSHCECPPTRTAVHKIRIMITIMWLMCHKYMDSACFEFDQHAAGAN